MIALLSSSPNRIERRAGPALSAVDGLRGSERSRPIYRTSEPNSSSLTRVRIFIFGRTAAIARIICPCSFKVMLYPRRNVASGPRTRGILSRGGPAIPIRVPL